MSCGKKADEEEKSQKRMFREYPGRLYKQLKSDEIKINPETDQKRINWKILEQHLWKWKKKQHNNEEIINNNSQVNNINRMEFSEINQKS